MRYLNLTHSEPKTTWPGIAGVGRWWAAWASKLAACKLATPAKISSRGHATSALSTRRIEHEAKRRGRADYEFYGRHLMANYSGCDPAALSNHDGLKSALESAIRAAGATLLDSVDYAFKPSGMTAVLLLSESHASIHTYPEHQACFVDLFTCGRGCSAEKFDAALREYLRPKSVQRRTMLRHEEGIEESPLAATEDWAAEWAA